MRAQDIHTATIPTAQEKLVHVLGGTLDQAFAEATGRFVMQTMPGYLRVKLYHQPAHMQNVHYQIIVRDEVPVLAYPNSVAPLAVTAKRYTCNLGKAVVRKCFDTWLAEWDHIYKLRHVEPLLGADLFDPYWNTSPPLFITYILVFQRR